MTTLTRSAAFGLDAFSDAPLALRPNASEDDLQIIITAVYRQVLGNIHLMESQRLSTAESQLRHGDITVREFVRAVAQSDLYRSLFFEPCSAYRFIELNFKHLLGRAPQNQAEIAKHVSICQTQGYAAEINAYIDEDEYWQNYGEDTVPYPRGVQSQVGMSNVSFNRMFSLLRGHAASDRSKGAQLISALGSNLPTSIKLPSRFSGAYSNAAKRFKITYTNSQNTARLRGSRNRSCTVDYTVLSKNIQTIHQAGGRVLSITEA